MKNIELWLPTFWIKPLFENDFSELSEDDKYKFMDFMDSRYLRHERFTPVGYDETSVDTVVTHDAMQTVKIHPLECVRVRFSVDTCWKNQPIQSI